MPCHRLNCEPIRVGSESGSFRFLSIFARAGAVGGLGIRIRRGKLIARSCRWATDRNTEGAPKYRGCSACRDFAVPLPRAAAQKMFAGSQVWLKKLVLGEARRRQQEGDQRLVERLARVLGRDWPLR
jgi:hypothetical protein